MRRDTITLGIEEKYSAEERAEIANNLAAAVAEAEAVSGEKKASDAAFNGRIKAAEEKVSALARQYNKGCEVAQIGCDIRYDVPEVGKKSYVRMDTGEAVEVHDMSWEEKQETIQFPLTPEAPEPTAEQIIDALSMAAASGPTDAAPIFRCPKCRNLAIVTLGDHWKCACGFETQDEDDLLIDLPGQAPEPPIVDPPPSDSASEDPPEAA